MTSKMEGRNSQRSSSSPGGRATRRNRSNEWRQRPYDSSSDNDDIGQDVTPPPASIVLAPAKSGDLTGYNAPFSAGRGEPGFSGERADHLHYASKPVSSAIYQSLSRRGRGGRHQHSSLSSSDNNSDTTTYAEGELRSKMDVLRSSLHTPPEPAPPEVPSRGPSSHQAVRSLQRLQTGYPADDDSNLPSPSEYRLAGSPRSHMGPSLRGYNPSDPDSYVSLDGAQTRLVLDGQKGSSGDTVMPLVMPVYPAVRNNLCHHVAPPAYSPERNHLKEECRYRCSWRLATICLALLCCLLLALIAYFAATGSHAGGSEQSQCVYVEDAVVMAPDSTQHLEVTTAPAEPVGRSASTRRPPVQTAEPPPSRLPLNTAVTHRVLPHQLWTLEHNSRQPQVVHLNVTSPWSASLAVYGSRNAPPTVTQHEWAAFVRAGRVQRSPHRLSRSVGSSGRPQATVTVTVTEYLESGHWYLAVLNDQPGPALLTVVLTVGDTGTLNCPADCSRHGSCHLGVCSCRPEYTGEDCSIGVCPVLCSNHGTYGGGQCHCHEGWKGLECDLPATDCEIADCHGHGACRVGRCVCAHGWKGEFCQTADCGDPTCSGHGVCSDGVCLCTAGWVGPACQLSDERIRRCLPDCSGHGLFDLSTDRCICDHMWIGERCGRPRCNLDCGPHGSCQAGDCVCDPGWSGHLCDLRSCDPRCSEHGQCKNGTCVCRQGWNGLHCSIPGCPEGCGGRGTCSMKDHWYSCSCHDGWDGTNCSIPLEMDCRDGIDNDGDGMADCSDSECCWDAACSNSLMCLISPEPVDVLLRKQPARQTASFYQRVKFLIEEKSVQDYAEKDEYSERYVIAW